MRILFAGTSNIAAQALRALAKKYELVGLLTQPDRPAGRHQKLQCPELKQTFKGIAPHLPILQPENLRDPSLINTLRALKIDVMVTMAYGKIIPISLLCLPRLASLNIQGSLLPRHRGASPIQAAIMGGDQQSGITIMYMGEGLDTGDVLLKKEILIAPRETTESLTTRLAELAPKALLESLMLLKDGIAPRVPQCHEEATITHRITHSDATLKWSEPAVTLERFIRAMNPKPGAHGIITLPSGKSIRLKIFSAHVRPLIVKNHEREAGVLFLSEEKEMLLCCGQGALLLEEVQPESRARMSFADLMRGHGYPG